MLASVAQNLDILCRVLTFQAFKNVGRVDAKIGSDEVYFQLIYSNKYESFQVAFSDFYKACFKFVTV